MRAFFDHFYPAEVAPIEPPVDFAERAGRFTGSYRISESSYSNIGKVLGLFLSTTISDSGDGALIWRVKGLEFRLIEVEPLYFRFEDADFDVVFREDDQGRITHMFTGLEQTLFFDWRMVWRTYDQLS